MPSARNGVHVTILYDRIETAALSVAPSVTKILGNHTIKLGVFLERFFATSQFKRSALPNAPKVGSGGSLSPRGDWRAPSDSSADVWLAELRGAVPDEAVRASDDHPAALEPPRR